MDKILILAPFGSKIRDLTSTLINELDYDVIILEEALSHEIQNKTLLGRKILKMAKDPVHATAEILKKYTESDRWALIGFPAKIDRIPTFDILGKYPDVVIILINSQVTLLERVKNNCTNIIEANQKIVDYLNSIAGVETQFERMNIPVHKINDNKSTKEMSEIIRLITK